MPDPLPILDLSAAPVPPPTLSERILRALASRIAVILALLWFVGLAFTTIASPKPTNQFRSLGNYTLLRENGVWNIYDLESRSADELTAAIQKNPQDVLVLTLTFLRQRQGILAATQETDELLVTVSPQPKGTFSLTPDQTKLLTFAMLGQAGEADSRANTAPDPESSARFAAIANDLRTAVARIPTGNYATATTLPWGYAINTISIIAALSVLFGSLTLWATWQQRLITKKLSQGVCPKCSYSLAYIEAITTPTGPRVRCPECGSDWPGDAVFRDTDGFQRVER